MRTYGRVTDESGKKAWVVIETDANGSNSLVYLVTMQQVMKLFLEESPFNANYGIPAVESVQTSYPPDFYASQIQQQFAQYFAFLSISPGVAADGITPAYTVNAIFLEGTILFGNSVDGVAYQVPQ